jgi:hypothetical protein
MQESNFYNNVIFKLTGGWDKCNNVLTARWDKCNNVLRDSAEK